MANDADTAARAISRVVAGLEKPAELEALTARALLDAAQSAARSRPTPQAPMVSAGFTVDAGAIHGPRSGTLADVTLGSELGSTRYRQFGARHGRGSWLFPTLADPPATVDAEQAAWLDDLLDG